MGWKTFKQKCQIEHIVHISKEHLCIGSSYSPEIVQIDLNNGKYTQDSDMDFLKRNYPLLYQMNSDEILELIRTPDVFNENIKVYLIVGGKFAKIIERECEAFGYPNCTHDGILMYDNTSFTERKDAIKYCIKDVGLALKHYQDYSKKVKKELSELEEDLKKGEVELNKFKKELENYK